jgi:hypothetical protein
LAFRPVHAQKKKTKKTRECETLGIAYYCADAMKYISK